MLWVVPGKCYSAVVNILGDPAVVNRPAELAVVGIPELAAVGAQGPAAAPPLDRSWEHQRIWAALARSGAPHPAETPSAHAEQQAHHDGQFLALRCVQRKVLVAAGTGNHGVC